jgi:Skp family chaperone for outer membrane proteins
MNNKRIPLVALMAALALGFAALPAVAQQPAKPKAAPKTEAAQAESGEQLKLVIAVIDMDAIRRDASAAKAVREQVTERRKAFEAEVQKDEETLRAANEELGRQRTVLSPEAFNEERRKFEQRLIEVQRSVQQRKVEIDRAQNEAMNQISRALGEVISEMATEYGLTLVLRKDQVVLVAKPLEITHIALERLDKKLPTVKVSDKPAGGAPTAAAKKPAAATAKKQESAKGGAAK